MKALFAGRALVFAEEDQHRRSVRLKREEAAPQGEDGYAEEAPPDDVQGRP